MTALNHKGNDLTLLNRFVTSLGHAWRSAKVRRQVRRERLMLADLDDRMLKDIGITRAEARFEAARSRWDVPEFRLPTEQIRDECPPALTRMAGRC